MASTAALAPEVTIWTDAARVGPVSALLDLMGAAIRPIGVGGASATPVTRLAGRLDCPHYDDLRKLLMDQPASFVLLASAQDVSREDLLLALGQASTLLVFEPVADQLDDLKALEDKAPPGLPGLPLTARIVMIPSFQRSPGWIGAADPKQVLEEPRLIGFDSAGPAAEGSLFARLFDAWRVILHYVPLPQSIDASLVGPTSDPPEQLRLMHGCLAAHARVAHGCTVALQVSDAAAVSRRRLHVLGRGGDLVVRDGDYELHQPDGTLLDRREPAAGPITFADLAAQQWRRLLDREAPPMAEESSRGDALVLACCLACLLSARTGQPEAPDKILKMHGG